MQPEFGAEPPFEAPIHPAVAFFRALHGLTPRMFVTPMLLGANVAVFAAMVLNGASPLTPSESVMLTWGADFAPYTMAGQWWRLITSAFVHFGIVHLAFNMMVLWDVGRFVERIVGPAGLLATYVVSALMASLASLLIHPMGMSAGASGAIFGVFGAFTAFLVKQRPEIPPPLLSRLMGGAGLFLFINAAIGVAAQNIKEAGVDLSVPIVDMSAHIGGLVTGFGCGWALSHPLTPEGARMRLPRAASTLLYGLAMAAACYYVMPKSSAELGRAIMLMGGKDYPGAVASLGRAIEANPAFALNYELRAECRLKLKDADGAIADLTKAIDLEPEVAYGPTLTLGFAYLLKGMDSEAVGAWRKSAGMVTDARKQAGVLENIGFVHLKHADWAAALSNAEAVEKLFPGNGWNNLIRAIAAFQTGDVGLAESCHRRWIEAPDDGAKQEVREWLPKELVGFADELPKPAPARGADKKGRSPAAPALDRVS